MANPSYVIHIATKHKVRQPVQKGDDIHIWISPKQRDCFCIIARSIDEVEPVSYHEIRRKMKLSSLSTVQHHIARLKIMGLICSMNTSRSFRLTDGGKAVWVIVKAKMEGK